MPQFQIHDSETGFKLLVEGPEEPSHEEAADLVAQEFQFLSTNLYHGADNKFMLDVGPLAEDRRHIDKMRDIFNEGEANTAAIERTLARVKAVIASGGDYGDSGEGSVGRLFENIHEQELQAMPKWRGKPTPTETTGLRLNPNTLLLVAHGAKTGGLQTEGGQSFTLHNVAQILGRRSNDIHNIINVACYGGKCSPEDYQAAFPNVTNIQSADPTTINEFSIKDLKEGRYFATNTTPGIWKRYGTNWMPQLPDYTKLPPPVLKE